MRGHCTVALAALLGMCAGGAGARATDPNPAQVAPSQAFIDYVADDAVMQVAARHLPAHQPLILARPFASPLQQAVLAKLRQYGYAVEEVASVADARRRLRAGSAPGPHSKGVFAPEPLYVDVHGGAVGSDLYHTRINVGQTVFARAYVLVPKGATPAGPWLFKEASE